MHICSRLPVPPRPYSTRRLLLWRLYTYRAVHCGWFASLLGHRGREFGRRSGTVRRLRPSRCSFCRVRREKRTISDHTQQIRISPRNAGQVRTRPTRSFPPVPTVHPPLRRDFAHMAPTKRQDQGRAVVSKSGVDAGNTILGSIVIVRALSLAVLVAVRCCPSKSQPVLPLSSLVFSCLGVVSRCHFVVF